MRIEELHEEMKDKRQVVRVYITVDVDMYNNENKEDAENTALEIVANDLRDTYFKYDIGIAELQP